MRERDEENKVFFLFFFLGSCGGVCCLTVLLLVCVPAPRPLRRFDPAATASRFITRRFGFAGGLAFVGLLASVEGGEILKALLEVRGALFFAPSNIFPLPILLVLPFFHSVPP